MATPLDVGLLQKFDVIFPFIFVLVIVYAILTRSEWFKERQFIALVIAFVLGVLTLFSRIAMKTLNLMAPWFILFVIFAILLLLAFSAIGLKETDIMKVILGEGHSETIAWWIISIMLIIGLGSLVTVVSEEVGFGKLRAGENITAAAGEEAPTTVWATIFHPKMLGMALILLIAMFTVSKLAGKTK